VREQVSVSYKTADKIIVLHVLIFTVSGSRWRDGPKINGEIMKKQGHNME
jgi:hypothetical protein